MIGPCQGLLRFYLEFDGVSLYVNDVADYISYWKLLSFGSLNLEWLLVAVFKLLKFSTQPKCDDFVGIDVSINKGLSKGPIFSFIFKLL